MSYEGTTSGHNYKRFAVWDGDTKPEERNKIRNETEFNLLKEWVTDYTKRNLVIIFIF